MMSFGKDRQKIFLSFDVYIERHPDEYVEIIEENFDMGYESG